MNRFTILSALLFIRAATAWGQCTVTKDGFGQVVTICESYVSEAAYRFPASSHQQVMLLGSEFYTFPVLQKGTIQLDESGKAIPCYLAFNLVNHEVTCQISKDIAPKIVTPYAFTINGNTFIRQPKAMLGIKYEAYVMLVYNGQTKLLKSLTSRLIQKSIRNGYEKSSSFEGYYQTKERYYIQIGDTPPQPVSLTKRSLETVLRDPSGQLSATIPDKRLTESDVVKIVTNYDSRLPETTLNNTQLSNDIGFTDFLQKNVKYPNIAWNNGAYGRVYAGFDVDETGQITNVKLLSPDNVGFGFDQAVTRAFEKLSKVKSDYAGNYVLPVTFTYTNRSVSSTNNVPINTLPADRLEGRTVLPELVVPVVISKTGLTSREVWGYYK
ncbi:TonB family protein [Spirosoma sp. RP8]|uniref:TonB family protein n=1 Tax=Spirosoma liriopis TaxID=2937440 RepID=A0ABT0HSL0_9BACT|nr:TonB family protein [Spirosoma liriopis]MCK8495132.1 TonB family protein [Spirosoma liriopis]